MSSGRGLMPVWAKYSWFVRVERGFKVPRRPDRATCKSLPGIDNLPSANRVKTAHFPHYITSKTAHFFFFRCSFYFLMYFICVCRPLPLCPVHFESKVVNNGLSSVGLLLASSRAIALLHGQSAVKLFHKICFF